MHISIPKSPAGIKYIFYQIIKTHSLYSVLFINKHYRNMKGQWRDPEKQVTLGSGDKQNTTRKTKKMGSMYLTKNVCLNVYISLISAITTCIKIQGTIPLSGPSFTCKWRIHNTPLGGDTNRSIVFWECLATCSHKKACGRVSITKNCWRPVWMHISDPIHSIIFSCGNPYILHINNTKIIHFCNCFYKKKT